jgi:hypothetical protein
MKALKYFIPIFSLCVIAKSFSGSQEQDSVYFSPSGRFSVKFAFLKHSKFENPKDLDETNNIKYQITFRDGRSGQSQKFDYHDVYYGKPNSPDAIFKGIIWSPSENFAVLPEEGWPRAPGAPQCKAVNLDTNYKWSMSDFHMDRLIWLDSISAAGMAYDDCDYSILLFDGATGRTTSIKEGESPIGYEIISLKDDTLYIQTVLDNCRSEGDEKKFVSQKLSLSVGELLTKLRKNNH